MSLPGGPIGGVNLRKYGSTGLLVALLVQFVLIPLAGTWHPIARYGVDLWFVLMVFSAVFAGEGGLSFRRPGVWLLGALVALRTVLVAWDESTALDAPGIVVVTDLLTAVALGWMAFGCGRPWPRIGLGANA